MGDEFAQRDSGTTEDLDWHLLDAAPHAQVERFVADLNRTYRQEPALVRTRCRGLRLRVGGRERPRGERSLSFLRRSRGGGTILCAFNFRPVPRSSYRIRRAARGQLARDPEQRCHRLRGQRPGKPRRGRGAARPDARPSIVRPPDAATALGRPVPPRGADILDLGVLGATRLDEGLYKLPCLGASRRARGACTCSAPRQAASDAARAPRLLHGDGRSDAGHALPLPPGRPRRASRPGIALAARRCPRYQSRDRRRDSVPLDRRAVPGATAAELVLYELHIGTFTAEARSTRRSSGWTTSSSSASPRARSCRSPSSGSRNWGYDGVDLWRADRRTEDRTAAPTSSTPAARAGSPSSSTWSTTTSGPRATTSSGSRRT